MFEHLPNDKILKKALKKGGDFADLFYEQTRSTDIVCEDKKIESAVSGIDCGAGLRIISNLKSVYGYTNDLSSSSLNKLAISLHGSLVCTPFDNEAPRAYARGFSGRASRPSKSAVAPTLLRQGFGGSTSAHSSTDLRLWSSAKADETCLNEINPITKFPIKIPPVTIPLEKKIDLVRKAEKIAWAMDKKIVQVRVRYLGVERHSEIANSDGGYITNPITLIVFSISVTASDGKEYIKGYESVGGHLGYELFNEEDIEKITKKAVRRALLTLSAPKAKGGTMPVVIASEAGGTFIHESVGHGLEADLACQGLSVYKDKIGQQIASPLVTIIDDPTLPKKRGSFSFDDEGISSQKTILIENGVLKDFMFDRLTAMKMGSKSNGHGRRESYKYRPIARMTNTVMVPGKDDPEKIIRSVNKGLFVKMMGGGEVNTVNGDFVFDVVEGYRIENGKIGDPVRGATLTGNGPEVLKSIDQVGSDLGFTIGTCGKDGQHAPVTDAMPTIRIPKMVVGGVVD